MESCAIVHIVIFEFHFYSVLIKLQFPCWQHNSVFAKLDLWSDIFVVYYDGGDLCALVVDVHITVFGVEFKVSLDSTSIALSLLRVKSDLKVVGYIS
jgi:hypothetical protein